MGVPDVPRKLRAAPSALRPSAISGSRELVAGSYAYDRHQGSRRRREQQHRGVRQDNRPKLMDTADEWRTAGRVGANLLWVPTRPILRLTSAPDLCA